MDLDSGADFQLRKQCDDFGQRKGSKEPETRIVETATHMALCRVERIEVVGMMDIGKDTRSKDKVEVEIVFVWSNGVCRRHLQRTRRPIVVESAMCASL